MILSQAVILAGGKGTRLNSRLNGLPKPLIEVCGKPLLQHQIELLIRHGIEDVLILTSHGSDQIQEFFNSHSNFGINITCISDAIPLGTAGAVLSAYPYLAKNFLLLYGDTMLDVDIKRFQHAHFSRNSEITIFLHPNDHPFDSDIVEVDMDGWVKVFHPYPHNPSKGYLPNLVNAALYIIDKAKLEPFTKNIVFSDFGKDFFPMLLKMGYKIAAYKSPEYIKDCGTPNRLDKVSSDFLSGKIQASNLKFKQNAIFLDRDGTINKYANYISNHSQLELLPGVSDAIRDLNKSTYRTIVVTNQPVIARGDASLADLNQIHNKLECLLAKDGAFVDSINFCPHHPDRGFKDEVLSLKINCYCRKPNIGLIEAATNDLNLDLSKSWMIGDTTIDVLTAKKAGLKSVLVETGKGGLDYKYMVSSDYVFADLKTAVSFILNDY